MALDSLWNCSSARRRRVMSCPTARRAMMTPSTLKMADSSQSTQRQPCGVSHRCSWVAVCGARCKARRRPGRMTLHPRGERSRRQVYLASELLDRAGRICAQTPRWAAQIPSREIAPAIARTGAALPVQAPSKASGNGWAEAPMGESQITTDMLPWHRRGTVGNELKVHECLWAVRCVG